MDGWLRAHQAGKGTRTSTRANNRRLSDSIHEQLNFLFLTIGRTVLGWMDLRWTHGLEHPCLFSQFGPESQENGLLADHFRHSELQLLGLNKTDMNNLGFLAKTGPYSFSRQSEPSVKNTSSNFRKSWDLVDLVTVGTKSSVVLPGLSNTVEARLVSTLNTWTSL